MIQHALPLSIVLILLIFLDTSYNLTCCLSVCSSGILTGPDRTWSESVWLLDQSQGSNEKGLWPTPQERAWKKVHLIKAAVVRCSKSQSTLDQYCGSVNNPSKSHPPTIVIWNRWGEVKLRKVYPAQGSEDTIPKEFVREWKGKDRDWTGGTWWNIISMNHHIISSNELSYNAKAKVHNN